MPKFPMDIQDLKDYEAYQRWMQEQGYIYVGDIKSKKMKWIKPKT